MTTRERALELRDQGLSVAAIAREVGVGKSTVCYHLRRAGEEPDPRFRRRYDWAEIQAYYDAAHSITACQERFGFTRQAWNDARRRGLVIARPQAMPIATLLSGRRRRSHLKLRLIGAGLLEPVCARRGIDTWLGQPLSLALHHVNGDGHDNRLENLRLLCPNCHSQTANFAGRNKRLRRAA